MKYIAFIGLGLVFLAVILYVVLWANMPTGKLAVYPVRPLSTNISVATISGSTEQWPAWEFAITNTGREPAVWYADMHFKDGTDERDMTFGENFRPQFGTLSNGQSATLEVAVPPNPHTTWEPRVKYSSIMSPLETKFYSWLKPVPKLRGILPSYGGGFAASVWYSGTNITIAH
jgi:hypothetical protein